MAKKEPLTLRNQDFFQVEKDCRARSFDIDEWDAAEKIANILWKDSALAGEFAFPIEVEKTVLCSAREIFTKLTEKKALTIIEKQILALEAVILTQKLDSSGEEAQLWPYIFAALSDDENATRYYTQYRSVLEEAIKGRRVFADFTSSKKYYNTLNIHALAPERSAEHLFNILYDFYAKNLEYHYEPEDDTFHLLARDIARRWENEPEPSADDMKLRQDSLASGLRMMFMHRPCYMAAVCDALTAQLDFILKNGVDQLDYTNRWNRLLKQWYDKKTIDERQRMCTGRKRASKERVVTRRENIHPQFYLSGEDVYLKIPRIRLPEINQRPRVQLLQNGEIIQTGSLHVFGDDLCRTSHEFSFLLEDAVDWEKPLHFELKIFGDKGEIYSSGRELFRKCILFVESGNEIKRYQRGIHKLFLLTDWTSAVEIEPSEEDCVELPAVGQLLEMNMTAVEHVLVNGEDVLTQGQDKDEVFCYLNQDCGICGKVLFGGADYTLITKRATLSILIPEREAPQNFCLFVDSVRHSLHEYGQNRSIEVSLPSQAKYFHQVELRQISSGRTVYRIAYILLPGFSCDFDQVVYPNRSGVTGTARVHCLGNTKTLNFELEQDQRELEFSIWEGAICQVELPKLNAILFGGDHEQKNALLLGETWWHQSFALDHFIHLEVPTGLEAKLLLAGWEVSRQRSHYEIGNFLHSRLKWGASSLPLGIKICCNGKLMTEVYLTEVVFAARFDQFPLSVTDQSIRGELRRFIDWNPAGFIGPPQPQFMVHLSDGDEVVGDYRLTGKKENLGKNFQDKDGFYQYRICLLDDFFGQMEEKELLKGELQVGEPNRNRFDGQELHLRRVYYWDKTNTSAPIQEGGGVLLHLTYLGISEPEEGAPSVPTYQADLYFITPSGMYQRFNDTKDSPKYEWINPVRIWIGEDSHLVLRTCGDDPIMINTKYYGQRGSVSLANAYRNMPQNEQYTFIKEADYFDYEIRDEL